MGQDTSVVQERTHGFFSDDGLVWDHSCWIFCDLGMFFVIGDFLCMEWGHDEGMIGDFLCIERYTTSLRKSTSNVNVPSQEQEQGDTTSCSCEGTFLPSSMHLPSLRSALSSLSSSTSRTDCFRLNFFPNRRSCLNQNPARTKHDELEQVCQGQLLRTAMMRECEL